MQKAQALTLVSRPGRLSGGVWERASALVQSRASPVSAPDWLAPGTACDWAVASCDWAALSADLAALKVDAALHFPGEERRKRLLIADMDSTLVQGETLDELADEAGIKDRIAAITARAMAGELDFAEALKERVAALAGLEEAALARTLARTRMMPGARVLAATMKASGAVCWLVSGGFQAFTEPVAAALGFDRQQGNRLEVTDGRLTGRVLPPILDRDAKLSALQSASGEHGLCLAEALAVGDGANDLAMLQAAGMGVAFHAKPAVRAAARFQVNFTDLRTLLFYQGIRAQQFAR